jgi:hypothetical protein
MRPEESQTAFEHFIRAMHGEIQSLSLPDSVDCFLRFYAEVHASRVTNETENGDVLLFQYGSYDFGKGLDFHFDLTRQFISEEAADDGAISQLHLTFLFAPSDEFHAVGVHTLWCYRREELPRFRDEILSSQAFLLARAYLPKSVTVLWEQV